jgi:hypothetical protein
VPRVNQCHSSLGPVPQRASVATSAPAPPPPPPHGPTPFSVILGGEERLAIGSSKKPYLTLCVYVCVCVCVCIYAGRGKEEAEDKF